MSENTNQQRLEDVVLEIERHAAGSGWDQPASMFALVDTAELLEREPQLAGLLGIEPGHTGLTPVEQEPVEQTVQELLATILWPPEVAGCAVVLEATTGSSTGSTSPTEEPEDLEGVAADGGEARIVAGALRTGEGFCTIRQRAHDEDDLVLAGADLVPGLLQLLHATLEPETDEPADEQPR
jgi:hypothetical protein